MASGRQQRLQGKVFAIAGPSGVGKNRLINEVMGTFEEVTYAPSCTTRPMRGEESQGNPYHFLTREVFMERVEAGEFLEWQEIFGNLYGTGLREYKGAIDKGEFLIKDIDVKGALAMRESFGNRAVLIFLKPLDTDQLRERLIARKDTSEEEIAIRMRRYREELSESIHFDYVLTNDAIEKSVPIILEIVKQELAVY